MTGEAKPAGGPIRPALPGAEDTIVALATAAGRGAIAVVRLSGSRAHAIARQVVEPFHDSPGRAYRATLRDPASGEVIDRPVVTVYRGPRSYTGEDLVEFALHGGSLVPALVTEALLAAGARQALAGEFTRRAVAHGKMDMLQAEAVADLVDAGSRAMHRTAIGQLDGSLSRRIAFLRDRVLALEALLAYDIDFPEEDEGPVDPERIRAGVAELLSALDALLATARTGEVVRDGALVVIAGLPNAGKSSLFNALLGRARAIVTAVPGTTRDAIEAVLEVGDWPVRLVDTAGLRESADVVERLGIEVSERYLRDADVVLACGESAAALRAARARVGALTAAAVLDVRTKSDLVADDDLIAADAAVAVSARTGDGLAALGARLAALVAARHGGGAAEAPLLTRARHRIAVERARDEVARFALAWADAGVPAVVAAVHLRAGVAALDELIGVVDVEHVLDRVFASFCVGK